MDSSNEPIPWQVEWKRPRWSQIPTSSSSSFNDDDSTIIVGSASAEIEPDEVPSPFIKSLENSSIMLSVTLLSRLPASHFEKANPVASELLLELYQLPATADSDDETKQESNSSSSLLASRRLQWPESVFDQSQDANQEEEATQKNAEQEEEAEMDANNSKRKGKDVVLSKLQDWLTLSPLMGKLDNKQKYEHTLLGSNPNGLLSAVLLRRPKNANQNLNADDVMDTIALMSLGMEHHSLSSQLVSQMVDHKEKESLAPSQHAEPEQEEESHELYLACMTVRGLVAIYSPWTLLQLQNGDDDASSDESDKGVAKLKKQPEFVDSLATLFLGHEIFSALEHSWKPLSEPLSTISLSLLEQNQVYKKKRNKQQPRALDVSLWNYLVDSATIPHRTVANRATQLAMAGPFLVVIGSGIPYTQVFRHDDESSLGENDGQEEWWDQSDEKNGSDEEKEKEIRSRLHDSNSSSWLEDDDDNDESVKVELISGPITNDWYHQDDSNTQEDGSPPDGWNNNQGKENLNEKLKVWWQKIRENSVVDDTEQLPLSLSTGGFITFCATSQWSETRTLFLPFVPKQVSYIPEWNSMEIVLVMGQTQAIAVRLDSSSDPVVIGNVTDQLQQSIVEKVTEENSVGAKTASTRKENYMNIKRFQILPIALPQSTVTSRILCGSAPGVQPPALLQLFTEETKHGLVLQKSLKGITALGTIELAHSPCDVAKIHVTKTESLATSWSLLGQGWSLLGTDERVYFICWEGATIAGGFALVQELDASPMLSASLPTCIDFVSLRRQYITDVLNEKGSTLMGAEESLKVNSDHNDEAEEEDGVDRIIVEAMESVSGLSQYLQNNDDDNDDDRIGSGSEEQRLSNREKSVRLLSRCSSWTRLEHTLDRMERQVHIVSLRSGNVQDPKYTLALRKLVVENGATSPIHQVLSWLADRGDYFTASSIALGLLRDTETLYNLWKSADKIDNIEEQYKLDGLLDGIQPIEEFEDENDIPSQAMVQLADMTVGCLAKGGFPMSTTLGKFLRENKLYDPSRACLMLVSTTANALSDYDEFCTTRTRTDELLWPVRCLLEAGVARDCLPTALMLLNSTIPDELRGRDHAQGASATGITSALVSAIVASDENAAELLLNLTEGTSKTKYWQSMDQDTNLILSLTFVRERFPLLLHPEVRSWAREKLHSCISTKGAELPSEWLKNLVSSCLSNAGCDQEEFKTRNLSGTVNDSTSFEESVNQHGMELLKFKRLIAPKPDRAGVDFDLLIPSLLILHDRGIMWNGDDYYATTQFLLDAASYTAGRHSNDLFDFAFDSSTVMKECAMARNIRAAANLIGGTNGLVLHCSDILIKKLSVTMKDAEAFLLSEIPSSDFLESMGGKGDFQLSESHRDLLLLLEEHVLTIKTYGEFDTIHIRGKVDPVFSSRSILRVWLCLSYREKKASTEWLVKYLRNRLKMEGDEGRSPYRLPCAALCRTLFWTEGSRADTPLSIQMGIDTTFLVQLALSCCGLVESIPLSIAQEISAKREAPKLYSMPQVQFPSASRLN